MWTAGLSLGEFATLRSPAPCGCTLCDNELWRMCAMAGGGGRQLLFDVMKPYSGAWRHVLLPTSPSCMGP